MKRKYISFILAVAMAVCFIPCAAKVYAEEMSVRITISENSVYAGSAVTLNAEVNGSASTDVTWSVSGNKQPDTKIDIFSTPYSSFNVLIVSVYEDAEEIVLRATSNEDQSKYDELTLTVIPTEYISQLRLSNDTYAACVDTSTTAIDLIHRFGESFRIEDPENNVHAEMACGLYRVPEGYSETEPDYRQFDHVDYGAYLDKDSEYYFVLIYQIKMHYWYDPDGFTVFYNGEEADHWSYGPEGSADPFLKVYIKAQMTEYNGTVRVIPYGISLEDFELEGNVISTKYESPVKAAYMSEGKYVTIPGSNGPDGSHSFVVPEGVEDVVLVVKGDADKDGKFTNFDVTLAKGALMGRHVSFDTFSKLASDISADGDFSNYDLTLMKAIVMGRYENGWS